MTRVSVWPRQLIPVAIIYLLAAIAYWYDRSRDRLIPLTTDDSPIPAAAVSEV